MVVRAGAPLEPEALDGGGGGVAERAHHGHVDQLGLRGGEAAHWPECLHVLRTGHAAAAAGAGEAGLVGGGGREAALGGAGLPAGLRGELDAG